MPLSHASERERETTPRSGGVRVRVFQGRCLAFSLTLPIATRWGPSLSRSEARERALLRSQREPEKINIYVKHVLVNAVNHGR